MGVRGGGLGGWGCWLCVGVEMGCLLCMGDGCKRCKWVWGVWVDGCEGYGGMCWGIEGRVRCWCGGCSFFWGDGGVDLWVRRGIVNQNFETLNILKNGNFKIWKVWIENFENFSFWKTKNLKKLKFWKSENLYNMKILKKILNKWNFERRKILKKWKFEKRKICKMKILKK